MTSGRVRIIMVVALAVLGVLLAASYLDFKATVDTANATATPGAVPSPGSVHAPAAMTPTAVAPGPSVECTPEQGALTPIVSSDPCPTAVAAVIAAVADIRLPLERIVVEPGPFYCNVIWPGAGSLRVCSMFSIQPGQWMHAWVRFADSDNIAAVMLGLDLPENQYEPGATRPPWNTTLVAVEVPPAGWVMP